MTTTLARTLIAFAILANVSCARAVQRPEPAPAASTSVWTADFMRTKPGQFDRYLKYLDANWARSRRTVLSQGRIRSFRVLTTTPTAAAPWDVVLLTEYPDSAAQANAESIFRPVLDAQGETLIDGLSGKGRDNPLKATVSSVVMRTAISGEHLSGMQ